MDVILEDTDAEIDVVFDLEKVDALLIGLSGPRSADEFA